LFGLEITAALLLEAFSSPLCLCWCLELKDGLKHEQIQYLYLYPVRMAGVIHHGDNWIQRIDVITACCE